MASSRPLAAAHVGALFVQEYYRALCQEPTKVHEFYKAQSVFSWGVEGAFGEKVASAIGSDEIHHEIMSLVAHVEKSACSVDVIGVDSQESKAGGIMVFVTGRMKFANNPRHPWHFNQVFFLDRQTESSDGYFILNDIMRYIVVPDTEASSTPESTSREVLSQEPVLAAEPAPVLVEPSPEVSGTVEEASEEEPAGSTKSSGTPGGVEVQPEISEQPNEEPPLPLRPTWASMARRLGDGGGNVRAKVGHNKGVAPGGQWLNGAGKGGGKPGKGQALNGAGKGGGKPGKGGKNRRDSQ